MPLELWAGAECTVNRVGDTWFDQVERTGHATRLGDMDRLASLGARTVRFPLLWERTVRDGGYDWRWADQRLARLRALGVRPIAGLMHHGSGPPGTSLLDPQLPERLAEFAGAAARRYPWIDAWTPINEPLTTARFSALYGHWYPHLRDTRAFVAALLLQCRAIAAAMRAIREVTPEAQLVQTDELARVRGTPPLAYQTDFENHRRWLSLDLLCGRVDGGHPLAPFLAGAGAARADLAELVADPCPPDLIGVNYYVTSERFLDHRVDRYPQIAVGGNGRDRYIDTEAVRVCPEGLLGLRELLVEAHERYELPLAVTEVQLSGSVEDQVSWLLGRWTDALGARAHGADVRAVTLWSAFGHYDWHNLVTRDDGVYEPGAFDVRGGHPLPTPLARAAQILARGRSAHHHQGHSGWWQHDDRLFGEL